MPVSPHRLTDASAGLGLRRGLLPALQAAESGSFDFLECAPENWIGVGGRLGAAFEALAERHPITCHGLSLSLGGPAPLDETLLAKVGRFLERHHVALYSEHLSWCSDDGQLYDLLPLPFTEEAVDHVATRIRRVQDVLGRRLAIENVSYYAALPAAPSMALDEAEFINAVLDRADCDLLLDVNNIHVNAVNHRYDPVAFLERMPASRIVCYHVAGHHDEAADLKVDTHGAAVIPDVWTLLSRAYRLHGLRPTLLERDFNFPPFAELLGELDVIRALQREAGAPVAMSAHG
ncbi:HvfB family MNIO-type RiPP peptide maturase [Luteimonas sp. SDU101]|uniref:HvfB family MNIO-type RiPP peptide maturase n=1 Tax=unclassified Luteimonas TaxID=2629088 RepID=UPI003EB775FA